MFPRLHCSSIASVLTLRFFKYLPMSLMSGSRQYRVPLGASHDGSTDILYSLPLCRRNVRGIYRRSNFSSIREWFWAALGSYAPRLEPKAQGRRISPNGACCSGRLERDFQRRGPSGVRRPSRYVLRPPYCRLLGKMSPERITFRFIQVRPKSLTILFFSAIPA